MLICTGFVSCSNLTGYVIINLIHMWNGYFLASRIRMVCITYSISPSSKIIIYYTNDGVTNFRQESFVLIKWFLMEMLKYRLNGSTENILKDLQETYKRVRDTYCEKYY